MRCKRIIVIFLIIVAMILSLWALKTLYVQGFTAFVEWLFQPVRIDTVTQRDYELIEEYLGVSIPASASFVEEIVIQARDPSNLYIFDITLTEQDMLESTDAFIRKTLSLDMAHYSITTTVGTGAMYDADLAEFGYVFTHVITYKECDFSEIQYCRVNENTIRVAFCYGPA